MMGKREASGEEPEEEAQEGGDLEPIGDGAEVATVEPEEGEEEEEGEDGEGEQLDTANLAEQLPDTLPPLDIEFKAKLLESKTIPGRKKTAKVQIVVPYDSEKIREINDLLGDYVTVVIRRDKFKEPESALERDALKQYWFNFGEEVGA